MDTEKQGHVAVIYVHGMGNQRRHEEVSRLVDSIDIYLSNSYRERGEAKGYLTKIRPRLELSLNDSKRTETYIRAIHRYASDHDWSHATNVRFYEVYWAPIMAQHSSVRRVLMWLFSQIRRPLQTIMANWRERQRLRRSTLVDLFEHPEKWAAGVNRHDIEELVSLYNKFEKPPALSVFRRGSFDDFLEFQKRELGKRPDKLKRCLALSRLWRSRYRIREAKNAFLLITLALLLLLLAGIATGLILLVLQQLSGWQVLLPFLNVLPESVASKLQPTWPTAFGLAVSLGGLSGVGSFLKTYMGDVESWATYEETDARHERRKRVIERGVDLISHVLKNPDCRRAVIVSHSLGTTVAHDTLLEAVRNNRAHNPTDPIAKPIRLDKIKHFVTLGSPIDKIHYFFESYKSRCHRYKRVVEELRGDIGNAPFSRNRKPYIHWINYWDEGDIISGALYSPANRREFKHRVDNVHVSNLHFPDPAASHLAYFDNRRVIGDLFDIIYKGAYDLSDAPLIPNTGYDYESIFLNNEDKPGRAKFYTISAILIPWLLLLGLIFRFLNINTGALVIWSLAAFTSAFVLIGFLFGKIRGHRLPL
ncbi:hypothetical protein [Desulforhopalus vacuolatus]|uniref:hypothetical protein n=1 Tax=Desulforhopalus vacuolatus TaxID=40414 RepID=UPI001962D22B|nr:hypothetical protein [Desulforhopalus vacuolatus]